MKLLINLQITHTQNYKFIELIETFKPDLSSLREAVRKEMSHNIKLANSAAYFSGKELCLINVDKD